MYKTSRLQRVGWRVGGVEGASVSYTEAADSAVVVVANSQMRTLTAEVANGSL